MLNVMKTSVACALAAGLVLPVWADDHAESVAEAAEGAAEAVAETGETVADAVEAESPAAPGGFDNPVDELSYAIGLDIGGSFRTQEIEINPQVMAEAIAAAYTEAEVKMTDEQAMAAIQRFQQEMQMKQMEKMMAQQQAAVDQNTIAGEKFLTENAAKEGVQQTESGLQYQVIEAGDGPKPGPNDLVTVHYKGQLIDGEVFDSSYDRGEPVTFGINEVIPGFGEGLQLMPVGSKGKLFIPGDIAYGMQGGPGGPMAALIFEVEVIATEPPAEIGTETEPAEELPALGD